MKQVEAAKGIVDLYHILSSPIYYNEITGQLVKGGNTFNLANSKGFRSFDKAAVIDYFGHKIRAYGPVY